MRHFIPNRSFFTIVLALLAFGASAHASNCSETTLKGDFGFTASGFLVAPSPIVGPFAGIGAQKFDGKGNTEATSTASINGNLQRVAIKGTYVVKSDCTGSMTLTFLPSGIVQHFDFVVSGNAAEMQGIRTDPGVVGTGAYRRLPGGD
jgi:hypothetical protein